MNTPVSININNLTLKVNKGVLIDDFNIEINESGLYFLTGENGCGKSTFLKTLCKIHDLYEGDVFIQNKKIKTWTNSELSKVVAFVNNYRAYNDYFSAKELVSLGNVFNSNSDINKQTELAMERMSILHLQNRSVHELSDGEYQKVNIARALSQNTPILLLDEPSAFLDYPSKIKLFQMLQDLAVKDKKLIFCSTHDIELAKGFSSHFLHFQHGKIELMNSAPDWH